MQAIAEATNNSCLSGIPPLPNTPSHPILPPPRPRRTVRLHGPPNPPNRSPTARAIPRDKVRAHRARHGHCKVGRTAQTWRRRGRNGNACLGWPCAKRHPHLRIRWRLRCGRPTHSNSPRTNIVHPSPPHHTGCPATWARRTLGRCSPSKHRRHKKAMGLARVDSWMIGVD